MSTLDYKEFMRTVTGFGIVLEAMKIKRDEEARRMQAEYQYEEHKKAMKQFAGKIVIGNRNRFNCNAEDAEFEEV